MLTKRSVHVAASIPEDLADALEAARGSDPPRARAAVIRLALRKGLAVIAADDRAQPGGVELLTPRLTA